MDFNELVLKRESIRMYTGQIIDRELIRRCLEAARLAPSACNSQPWKFIVVDDKELTEKVTINLGLNKKSNCRNYIVIASERRNIQSKIGEIIKKKDFTSMDVAIAAEHIALQAADLGIGSCLIGWFNEKELKKILGIPKNREIQLVISMGYYGNKEPRAKKRKSLQELISYNKY